MRQHQLSERGSANWPFIITLILLLVFAYMWFDEKDQREQAQIKETQATEKADAYEQAATLVANYAADLSQLVGWTTDQDMKSLIPDPVGEDLDGKLKAAAELGRLLVGSRSITNLTKLDAQLTKDGAIDGEPGLLAWLINEAEAEILKDMRSDSGDAVSETPTSFDWMTPDFKAKLLEIDALQKNLPGPPKPVFDPDDAEDVARYENELANYNEAVAAYEQALNELQQMEGWKKWDRVIKGPRGFNPDERTAVKIDFFTQALTSRVDVETLMGYPKQAINALISELKKNKDADAAIIDAARADAAAKAATIDNLQNDLREEQDRHTADVQQLNADLTAANETAESNRLEATQALQRVTVVEEEKRRDVAEKESRISALENRIRIDKEDRDLRIRRDTKDGSVLSASPILGTAIIDLGSRDKVYPGLKFNVSYLGKGGFRLPKGQVMVTRVLGPKSAKVAIVTELPGNGIAQGDIIHNPLWDTTDTIHVFLAGELERYPIEIARARLTKMGVILDGSVDGDTDYIVVPDAMAAPPPAAGADDEDMDEENVGGKSEFERIQALGRTFGATVITEKMLNEFLDY